MLLTIVIVTVLFVGGLLAMRTYGSPRRWRSVAGIAPPLLRSCSLTLLAVMVLNPTVPIPTRTQRDWIIVVDGSASMAIPDTAGRCRAARGIHAIPRAFLRPRIAVAAEQAVWATPDSVSPEMLNGHSTDIGSMLRTVARLAPRLRRVVLVSDGRQTGGTDPAAEAVLRGMQVSTVYVDARGEPRDVSIAAMLVPSKLSPDQPFEVPVSVRFDGGTLRDETQIALELNGVEVARRPLPITPDSTSRVSLPCPGLPPGRTTGTVILRPVDGEQVLGNNQRSFEIPVRERRWSVYIASDRPTWDLAFLARSLQRDGGFDVGLGIVGIAPSQLSGSEAPHVLVVGQWGGARIEGLRNTAEKVLDGGGVVVVLGWPSGATWADICPLRSGLEPGSDQRLLPRPDVRSHPLVAALGAHPENPPVSVPGGPIAVSPMAQVILETEDGAPVLAVQSWRRGHVLAWLGADWWRWQLAAAGAQGSWNPWPHVIRWLLSPDAGSRVRLHMGKEVYRAGEPIEIGVEVFEAGWELAGAGTVTMVARTHGRTPMQRTGRLLPDGRMTTLDLPGLAAGQWDLNAEVVTAGGDTLSATAQILVTRSQVEDDAVRPDPRTLQQLARHTGGVALTVDDRTQLDSLLSAGSGISISPVHARRTPLPFLILLVCLTVEWWLRTRHGLP